MQRIPAREPADAPAESRSLLEALNSKFGMAPNFFKTIAH